jgi:hypothetical protein
MVFGRGANFLQSEDNMHFTPDGSLKQVIREDYRWIVDHQKLHITQVNDAVQKLLPFRLGFVRSTRFQHGMFFGHHKYA